MTSLRLFETDGAAAADARSHLFDTPSHLEHYRARSWPYATSMILHVIVMTSVVVLVRVLTQSSPPPPTPSHENREVAHTFVFTASRADHNVRPRGVRKTQRSRNVPIALAGDVAPPPTPPVSNESHIPATPLVEDKPRQTAFDPPVPAGNARMTGRFGDPKEAGFESARPNARGSSAPAAETRPGGLGDGNLLNVRNGSSMSQARAGFDDGIGDGGGAIPPRIQEPLPVPDYPPEARTRGLQGVVVLEVMLDSLGRAHVRGVLSERLGFGIEEAATTAAERLKFTPARQGGRSVDAVVQVRVTFMLSGGVATTVTGGA
jgi:protein TonB